MPLISKPNYNQIFASQAPDVDEPAEFNNYPQGWDEARKNNGKPTIKGFNFLQQTSDLKSLWILQNGACLPYDEAIEYAIGAPVLKDGVIQYKTAGGFDPANKEKPYTLNYFIPGTSYPLNAEIMLANGDTVKSTASNNIIDPNVDMTGWVLADAALNTQKLSTQFVSVWDFFTKSETQAYNYAILMGTSATFNSYRPLKEFFDYIAANNVGTAYCNGYFYTSKGLVLGGSSGSLTKKVIGNFTLDTIAGSVIHTQFSIQAGQNFEWDGLIVNVGTGGLIYANRTVRRALVIGGEFASTHTYIKSHQSLNGFIECGLLMADKTTGSCVDSMRETRCGSGLFKAGNSGARNWSLYSNFTVYSEVIAAGYTQNTVLQVNTLPPEGLFYLPQVEINGELYNVQSIDYVNSRLTLFPLLNRTNTATELKYYFGAGVATAGSDASTTRLNKINVSDNAIGYHSGALYPATVGTLTVEANGQDVILGGNSISQAHVGGMIEAWHYESADYSLVRRTYAPLSFVVGSTNYEFALSKVYDLTRPRNPDTNLLTGGYGMQGITFAWGGEILKYENPREGGNNVTAIDVTDINRSEYWHYGTSKTFNIAAPNSTINRLFGYNRKSCVVAGTNNAGNPTGDIVFNAPAGYTVNGTAAVTFNGFTQAAKFDVYLQWVRNNFIVTCSTLPPTSPLSASVTYDPPSLAAAGAVGDFATTNVTLAGVALGDNVNAAFNKYNAAVDITCQVSAANTVTVKFKNTSTVAVDLSSGTLIVKKV